MTHTSAALFATPSFYEPCNDGVPCGYIHTSNDNALPLPVQQQMAAQLGPDTPLVTLDCGHCPHLSMPEPLLDAIKKVEAGLRKKISRL
jgi:pimeloyl-ACP methyl ester carboxylesterase